MDVTVPFLDVGAAYAELRDEIDAAVGRVVRSGWYVGGPEVAAFEAEFGSACGAAHCVGVGNGLDALTIALQARGIGPGDEVIVPAHTFIATWLAVHRAGASVCAVDVDPETLLIDPAAAAAAISPRTAAIVPVHLYGAPADLTELGELAARHGLFLLSDAAQAHGADHCGRDVGGWGAGAAYSFYPAKNLGALGDAGALTTDDAQLAERARRLRSYGARPEDRYRHVEPGVNSRLDPVQAAALRVKLPRLADWNARRRRLASAYRSALAGIPELTLPADVPGSVWHLFAVRHPRRDALAAHLERAGIQTLIHYPEPPHRSAAFAGLGLREGVFPVTEDACRTLLSLPIGPHLDAERQRCVVEAVRSFPA